jgi:hypothetical protein
MGKRLRFFFTMFSTSVCKAFSTIGHSKKSRNTMYKTLVQEPQHYEDYEEASGENNTIMDLQNFEDNENWLGTLVDGQSDDLESELSEDMKSLDVGGRHLGNESIQHGLYKDDEEEYKVDDFWTTIVVQWTLGVYVSA